MDTVLEKLLESPKLNLLYAQLHQVIEAEQRRREQFRESLSAEQKSEFINGDVVVQSPVKLRHNQASHNLSVLLVAHVRQHNLGLVGHEKLLVAMTRNDYEPDVCFFTAAKAAAFLPDQMIFPAPDFIAEVLSPSTEAIDRGVKFEDYAAHGVAEYWIVDPETVRVEQYVLAGETYELTFKADNGSLVSRAVFGFVIPVRALFDEQEHLATLRKLLNA